MVNVGAAVMGIIGLVIIGSVYSSSSGNFTGLTGTVMSFFTVAVALALLVTQFKK